ncbi:hypothetical protein EB820_05510 [Brevibacillus agri]|uniref:Uncharacterized protein n=1 Tax=Brevibacillus agri TaxID=51101 RepID=A0A3M8B445_9BACL|nr:hypothetical protein BA6348_18085 [Brevibacillus agri]RNB58206.1 hypothetical protein EB820_05510 [Brevibacillus agri]
MPNHARKRPSEMRPEHPAKQIAPGSRRVLPGLPVTAAQSGFCLMHACRRKQQEWHRGSTTSRLFYPGDAEVFLFSFASLKLFPILKGESQ